MASMTALSIIRRAREGRAESQYQLGQLYLEGGEGLGAHEQSAYLWLARAAAAGYAPAWRLIGERLSPAAAAGDERLIEWYERAATDGGAVAQLRLARLLLARGAGTMADAARVTALLRSAVGGGCGEACLELGQLMLAHAADETNHDEACSLLEQAWNQGEHVAGRMLAEHYWKRRDAERARLWYERCVTEDDAEACYRLGLLDTLLGGPGIRFLEQAAEAGHPEACEELGVRYAVGTGGTRRNLKKAVRWLEGSANGGSARACFLLAMIHRHPRTVVHDRNQARAWLFRAAHAGHVEACLRAGILLVRDLEAGRRIRSGDLGGQEPELLAVRYLRAAEREGLRRAVPYLARLATRARPSQAAADGDWEHFLATVRQKDPAIAARLDLGRTLGLTTTEMLTLDLATCDQGDYLILDLPTRRDGRRRRIVLIDTAEQRRRIDEARRILAGEGGPLRPAGRPENQAQARQRRLRRISRQAPFAGIDAALFPRADR